MSTRKPLVIVNGLIEQLQAGDTLDAPTMAAEVVQMTNGEAGSILFGEVVYISAADTVKKAQANALATAKAFGFVYETSIGAAAVGSIATDGILSGLSGLTAGADYFVDPTTPGVITSVAPTTIGEVVQKVGRAISATEFEISIAQPVLL